jgi:hypothetical protein
MGRRQHVQPWRLAGAQIGPTLRMHQTRAKAGDVAAAPGEAAPGIRQQQIGTKQHGLWVGSSPGTGCVRRSLRRRQRALADAHECAYRKKPKGLARATTPLEQTVEKGGAHDACAVS